MRRPFREYVAWLRRQDQAEAAVYWSALLADFDSPSQLPFDRRPGSVPPSGQPPREQRLELSETDTEALLGLSKQLRCTMSTILQAHPDVDVDVQQGGQPHYHLLLSAE